MHPQIGQTTRLVLASGSPRRKTFLESLGFSFEVIPAEIDETPRRGEKPAAYVERLATEKAASVAKREADAVVLAADTTVVLGDRILGKPVNPPEAIEMLTALSGREHAVLTAVAVVVRGAPRGSRVVETQVRFRVLDEAKIGWYVDTREPMDKAGAYAIQGVGGSFVESIAGSYTNVVGLPMVETLALLETAGVAMPWGARR